MRGDTILPTEGALSFLADLEIKKLGPFSSAECSEGDVKLVKKEIE